MRFVSEVTIIIVIVQHFFSGDSRAFLTREEKPTLRLGGGVRVERGGLWSGPRREKMLYSWTDPESYITEYTRVYEEKSLIIALVRLFKPDMDKILGTHRTHLVHTGLTMHL